MFRNIYPFTIVLFLFISPLFGINDCYPDEIAEKGDKEVVRHITKQVILDFRADTISFVKSEQCLFSAIRISETIGYSHGMIKSYDLLGRIYLVQGNFEIAKGFVLRGLKIADSTKNLKNQARMLNSLGNIENERGNVEDAISYYLQSKKAWSLIDGEAQMVGLDINIACLYFDQKNYSKAYQIFSEALNNAKKLGKDNYAQFCHINLGALLEEIGNYEQSLTHFETLLDPKYKTPTNLRMKALSSASAIHLKLGNVTKANEYFSQALNVKDDKGKLNLYVSWGDGLVYLGHIDEAIQKYSLALNFALEINDIYLISQIYDSLSKAYKTKKDYETAWFYYEKHASIKDTLVSREKEEALNEIVTNYEERERKLKIESLEKQRESDRIIKFISIILVIVLFITLIVFYSRYKIKKEASDQLKSQNETLQFQNKQIKSREILLRKSKVEIEEKNILLATHTQKIDSQNKELQRYNMDLEQFAYSVSHDLRAPIRSIHSFLHLIHRNINDQESIKEYLSIAQENSQLLANLLEDLLTYTRVGRSELEPVLVDLNETINKVRRNLDHSINQNGTQLSIGQLPIVLGFPADMYLLFQNLLQNAIKFRHPDRESIVSITHKEYDKYYVISLADNGIGIKPEYQKQIFRVFQRIDNKSEGTGIGLAIVKKIIDYNNGEIYLESQEGVGTTFHVRLKKS